MSLLIFLACWGFWFASFKLNSITSYFWLCYNYDTGGFSVFNQSLKIYCKGYGEEYNTKKVVLNLCTLDTRKFLKYTNGWCPYQPNKIWIFKDRVRYGCVSKVPLFILTVGQDWEQQPHVMSLGTLVQTNKPWTDVGRVVLIYDPLLSHSHFFN